MPRKFETLDVESSPAWRCEFRFNHRHEEMYEVLLDSCENYR